ncbi:ATP-grasp fold amidoligase family protein [Novosphingobium aquimarinum]|uniref:ATP-grasp fold amidoligase family protein n=1 Tax=Novosphingobium aquimarinum TaxID=2682494 RepID=UPI0012EB8ECA|nr:ATP-grasp fold amidoligase family protein [Novosphingobium aquimarinum]
MSALAATRRRAPKGVAPGDNDRSSEPGTVRALAVRSRIALTYLWRHGRWPRLADPVRFTEYVQRRKLCERDPAHIAMTDKLAAKAMAETALGKDWVVPLLWQGHALADAPPFAFPAMLKARHGCKQCVSLPHSPSERQWLQLMDRTDRWTRSSYGTWLDEWSYADVPRGLLAETLLGDGRIPPIDYKIYVFGGRATHIQVHLGRESEHRWILHDRDWRQLVPQPEQPLRPRSLSAMLDAAEVLAAGQAFVRVDFYEVGGCPLFGEFSVYPGSGLDPFAAPWIDVELGRLWRDALQASGADTLQR